jgi:tetratricopeptide (TPR) repeat protein
MRFSGIARFGEMVYSLLPSPRPQFLLPCFAMRQLCLFFWIVIVAVSSSGCLSVWGERRQAEVQAARQLTLRGIDASHQEEWQLATQLFSAALERDEDDARTRYHYARALWQLSRPKEAIAEMERAAETLSDDPYLYVELGRMYFDDGQYAEAERWALKAINVDWHFPSGRRLYGDCQTQKGSNNEALESYHRALAERPDYPEVQLACADIYRRQDRPRRALATLGTINEQGLSLENAYQVQYHTGLAQKTLGRYQEATRSFSKALAHTPDDTELLYYIGESQLLEGRYAAARMVTRDALTIDPNNKSLRTLLSRIESDESDESDERRVATEQGRLEVR